MLTIQKLESIQSFTPNEKLVADYIVHHYEHIKELSITDIAGDTFTSPSTLVRLSQKCGYAGWKELKNDLIEEINYIDSHFHSIDPNKPFTQNDSSLDVVKSITALLTDTIQDSLHLLDTAILDQCVTMLDQASLIYIYGLTHAISSAYDFYYKMLNIGKKVVIINDFEELPFLIHSDNHIAHICISYSGETIVLNNYVKEMRLKGAQIIAITSIGDNTLSKNCDYMIPLCTREKLHSKIAPYTSNESIHYVLDILYSLLFQKHFDKYMNYKIAIAKKTDVDRISTVDILEEK